MAAGPVAPWLPAGPLPPLWGALGSESGGTWLPVLAHPADVSFAFN